MEPSAPDQMVSGGSTARSQVTGSQANRTMVSNGTPTVLALLAVCYSSSEKHAE